MLLKHDEVFPSLANRIVSLAENQSSHRQRIESKVVDANVNSQRLGLLLGALICLVAIAGGIYLILNGKDISGLAAIIAPLASLSAVFVYAKREQRIERENKNLSIYGKLPAAEP